MKHHDLSFLQAELSRQTGFIQFADSKIAFLFTANSALLAFWLSKIKDANVNLSMNEHWFIYGAVLLLFVVFYALVLTAIFPRLKAEKV